MAQKVEFNWAVKVKEPKKVKSGEVTAIVKSGVRLFPTYKCYSVPLDLLDWRKNKVGEVGVTGLEIKEFEGLNELDAEDAGFESVPVLKEFLKNEYGKEELLMVTVVRFRLL